MKNQAFHIIVVSLVALVVAIPVLPATSLAKEKTSLNKELLYAVAREDVAAIKTALEKGADINAEPFGETPLEAAIRRARLEVVQLLLEKGADPNGKDEHGTTPLQWAFRPVGKRERSLVNLLGCSGFNGACNVARFPASPDAESLDEREAAIVRLLLRHGADPNTNLMNGTVLTWAAFHGDENLVKLLLSKGVDVNARTWSGATALQWAAIGGHETVVKLLERHGAVRTLHDAAMIGDKEEVKRFLRKGADTSGKNVCGRTPLMEAAWGGNPETIRVLLKNGADVNQRGAHRETPLMVATWRRNLDAARFLLDNEAEVNAANEYGWTPLMEAAWAGHLELAQLLVDRGADVRAQDNLGKTAFMHAVKSGRANVAKLLLDKGADAKAIAPDGWTAVTAAAKRSNVNMMKLLRKYGAKVTLNIAAMIGDRKEVQRLLGTGVNINGTDSLGRTALMWAAAMGYPDVVRLLLDKGANVNSRDYSGRTAMMWAAAKGHAEIVKLLCDSGGDIDAVARNGWTALMWASSHEQADVVRLLAERGAELNRKDGLGRTAMRLADGNQGIVRILKSHGGWEGKIGRETDRRKRGDQCGEEWDFVPLHVVTGAPAPRSRHTNIRLDYLEGTIRLGKVSFVVDAVFGFYNTGETTSEWVGFPRRGNTCRDGRLLNPTFLRFDTWINGRKVKFLEKRGLLGRIADSLGEASSSWPKIELWAKNNTFDQWLMKRVTFPAGKRTTLRLCYEDAYGFGTSVLLMGTGSCWKDSIRYFVFTVDASGIGGTVNLTSVCNVGLSRITADLVRYEVRDYKPELKARFGASERSVYGLW